MHLYNAEGISYIANVIGKPLYMDRSKANQAYLDFAGVCIEVQADKEIEQTIKLDVGNNLVSEVQVVVPWMPTKCRKCLEFGHKCDDKPIMENQNSKTLKMLTLLSVV